MQLFYEDNQKSLKISKKFSNQSSLRKFGMLFVTEWKISRNYLYLHDVFELIDHFSSIN